MLFQNRFSKGVIILLTISLALCEFSGCNGDSGKDTSANSTTKTSAENTALGYAQITAEEAKHLMDPKRDFVILDVRTEEEFNEGHIKGAVCIPDTEIATRAEKELPNKDQLILVYCRSGRRSKLAAETLANLGYTNVQEFGGILDWPYETVK